MESVSSIDVLDKGFVKLRNLAGPVRRPEAEFDADDIDPAITARISFDNLDAVRAREQDLKLVQYLMKNRHWTPVEMIEVWLEMKLPIFVARQFVRHRTACLNEVSARYVKLPADWYIPSKETLGVKSKSNKQGRDLEESLPDDIANWFGKCLEGSCASDYRNYQYALDNGVPPELARSFLHVNHYTHWVWKQDLRNLMGFLSLRLEGHAQYEARVYAQAVYDLVAQHLPETLKFLEQDRFLKKPEEKTEEKPTGLLAYLKRVLTEGV